jgi:hypothetical protein
MGGYRNILKITWVLPAPLPLLDINNESSFAVYQLITACSRFGDARYSNFKSLVLLTEKSREKLYHYLMYNHDFQQTPHRLEISTAQDLDSLMLKWC